MHWFLNYPMTKSLHESKLCQWINSFIVKIICLANNGWYHLEILWRNWNSRHTFYTINIIEFNGQGTESEVFWTHSSLSCHVAVTSRLPELAGKVECIHSMYGIYIESVRKALKCPSVTSTEIITLKLAQTVLTVQFSEFIEAVIF